MIESERDKQIWKDFCDAICDPIEHKRLWKPECITCDRYDRIEHTGCFLNRCKLTGESTWIDEQYDDN